MLDVDYATNSQLAFHDELKMRKCKTQNRTTGLNKKKTLNNL